MPRDAVRLRAELAQCLQDLDRLLVVEEAEEVVRLRHVQVLGSELAGLHDELADAQRHLGAARRCSDLEAIMAAEEWVCEALRRTTLMQRKAGETIRGVRRARNAYLTRRRWLEARIEQLQRLVA